MKNKNILITGGAGFLGTHLIQTLIENGFNNITVVDKIRPNLEGITYVFGDFADEQVMKPLLNKSYALFHLAAIVGVDICRNNPKLVAKTNIIDAKKLIDWSIAAGIKRIVFTSSSEVYGNSVDIPYKEDGKLLPVSLYGQAKVEIEEYLKQVQQASRVSVGIVRPFNVYGPGQKQNFVVPIFIQAAVNNNPINIFGSGEQTRTFTYVEDVTDGILKLYMLKNSSYEIVNLGSTQEYSIKDAAKLILKILPKSKSKIVHLKYGSRGVRGADYEIARRVPSIQKAKDLLSFEAETTLTDGIKIMLMHK
jgi:UDP-glucose 4-epimerase